MGRMRIRPGGYVWWGPSTHRGLGSWPTPRTVLWLQAAGLGLAVGREGLRVSIPHVQAAALTSDPATRPQHRGHPSPEGVRVHAAQLLPPHVRETDVTAQQEAVWPKESATPL